MTDVAAVQCFPLAERVTSTFQDTLKLRGFGVIARFSSCCGRLLFPCKRYSNTGLYVCFGNQCQFPLSAKPKRDLDAFEAQSFGNFGEGILEDLLHLVHFFRSLSSHRLPSAQRVFLACRNRINGAQLRPPWVLLFPREENNPGIIQVSLTRSRFRPLFFILPPVSRAHLKSSRSRANVSAACSWILPTCSHTSR